MSAARRMSSTNFRPCSSNASSYFGRYQQRQITWGLPIIIFSYVQSRYLIYTLLRSKRTSPRDDDTV
ncbi:unnamed protein product [Mycena citricolor]|uniref:Uncharacterized protein n=1 Tax=Mycena citricolor TaxID=2018698 RepID=A0AAD2HDG7_9AGAR|nr:unnamed protein product [Mycena citricolor]